MNNKKQPGGLDYFKIVAALLVVAIHTSPLSSFTVSFSGNADFILARIISRIAVPFFLMVTGQFLLPQYLYHKSANLRPLCCFIRKTLLLYATAIIIYLPVNLYAGQLKGLGLFPVLRMLVFDGTFYHLWYLPASVIGVLLVFIISRKLPLKAVGVITVFLYFMGLLGDSYFGFLENRGFIRSIYDALFRISSYTRNGIFYAPVFLFMGAWLGHARWQSAKIINMAGFAISFTLMIMEGLTLHRLGMQRHDSMYLALLPCMFFLYQILLSLSIKPSKHLRKISTWIYLVHPLIIIVVRGGAKAVHFEALFIDNSLIHYAAVCMISYVLSLLIFLLTEKVPAWKGRQVLVQQTGLSTGRAWIEINQKNLRRNVLALRHLLPEGCELMPAVKADAYGHGAVLISRELNALGVKAFCVASITEGIELRRNGIKGDILILGYTHPEEFFLLRKYHLIQTVIDDSYAKSLNAYGKKIKVHLKIDTGMHRLGIRCERLGDIGKIFLYQNLIIEGAYTHLCTSDMISPKAKADTLAQGAAFYEVISQLQKQGFSCPKIHLQASYGLLNYPELSGCYARIGIALYGMLSDRADRVSCPVRLHPVLSVKTRVAAVKTLYQGEAAGYGLQYVAMQDTQTAALAIGYADGLPRSLSCGVGSVLINGCEAPIIGRICMDQTIIDITNVPDVKPGDIAVIIGKSGKHEITAYDLAAQSGTITNELLSRLGSRLNRIVYTP